MAPGGAAPGAPASAAPQIPAGLGPMATMAALAAAAAQSGGGASWTAGQASAAGLRGIVAGEALRGLQAACAEGAAEQGPTNSLCSLVRLLPGAGWPCRGTWGAAEQGAQRWHAFRIGASTMRCWLSPLTVGMACAG